MDIICIEATFHFNSYHQASEIANRYIAEPAFFIIQKLILNNAVSKLLTDEHDELNNYLKMNRKNKYYQESLWNLIARIAELHELKAMSTLSKQPDHKTLSSNMNSPANLVAQQWQSNGLLSETTAETPTNNHSELSEIPSSLPVNPVTDAEIVDQLLVLSHLPPKLS